MSGKEKAHTWYQKAVLRYHTRRFEEALMALERTLMQDRSFIRGYCTRGRVLTRLNRLPEALESFERPTLLGHESTIAKEGDLKNRIRQVMKKM